ncbi:MULTISPECIES: TetR/AcrR family transcriptional regulator [unclassified Luteococcus]|uniref:TetR/AcrR family transcriptional regulator n=1 Tax=unclassified Luteococcus TaxID=2639923 RepID=UPI00313D4A5E
MTTLRTDLLHSAAELVASRGLEALTIRAVAAQAGASIGAVQHHFPTKADLLLALVDAIEGQIRADLETSEAASGRESAPEALHRLTELLGGATADAQPSIRVWLAFVAHALGDPTVAKHHRQLWRTVEDSLARLLEGAGVPAMEAADRAAILLASLDGIAIARAMEPDRMPLERCRRLVHQATTTALA